jgi:hypothetical protein
MNSMRSDENYILQNDNISYICFPCYYFERKNAYASMAILMQADNMQRALASAWTGN